MSDCPTPKPMPTTGMPDRASPGGNRILGQGAVLGNMQVTNGRPPKGGK